MITSFTFWLIVLAVLAAYLCVSVWLRHQAEQRREQARLRAIEREFPARAFDTSAIAPQLQRLRRDYVASVQTRWPRAQYRAQLVAAARRLIASLSYFCHARHEHELHKHDA